MSEDEIESIIKELDYTQTGKINYTEFLGATININEYLSDEVLNSLYASFQDENSNELD